MGPLLGILLVMIGIGAVLLGMTQDLRKCHTEQQRATLWSYTIGVVAVAIVATILARIFPDWLAWIVWIGFIVALVQGVRWLQGALDSTGLIKDEVPSSE